MILSKLASALITAILESLLYSLIIMGFLLVRVFSGSEEISEYLTPESINNSITVFLVVVTSIFITRLLGGSSFRDMASKAISSDKPLKEVSMTMVIGSMSGLITFIILFALR